MSATIVTTAGRGKDKIKATTAASDAFTHAEVSQWRVIKAEAIKFFSLRSNLRTIIASVIIIVGFGALAASVMTGAVTTPGQDQFGDAQEMAQIMAARMIDPTALSMVGVTMAVLVLGTTGVLAMTGEFSSAMIRVTAGAVPKRLPFLWGKFLVLVITAAVTMSVAVFGAFFLTQTVLSGHNPTASLSDPGVLRALFGNVAYLVGAAVIGLALGALLRSAAAGISTLAATLLIVPGLISLILPAAWAEAISPYLPSAAAQGFTTVDPTKPGMMAAQVSGGLLSPGAGALVFAAWVIGLLAVAAVTLKRRDV